MPALWLSRSRCRVCDRAPVSILAALFTRGSEDGSCSQWLVEVGAGETDIFASEEVDVQGQGRKRPVSSGSRDSAFSWVEKNSELVPKVAWNCMKPTCPLLALLTCCTHERLRSQLYC